MISLFHGGLKDIQHGIKKAGFWILLVSVFTVGYRLSATYAQQFMAVSVVVALKRSASLFVTIFGGQLFHEKDLFRKAVACCIMIGGVLLLVL